MFSAFRPITKTTRLRLERLEAREVPAFTDLSQVAALFPRHDGPNHLYLNFDGISNFKTNDGHTYNFGAFRGTRQDRQEILFRTAEIFSPFDVEVSEVGGIGTYDSGSGSTTVFIGPDAADTQTQNGMTVKVESYETPGQYSDYPGDRKGTDHRPNSDSYDLAFVDPYKSGPTGGWVSVDNRTIAGHVAHEAGHTFGLTHVYADPKNDPALTAAVGEIMSYRNPNQRTFFADQSFPITTDNWDPQQQKYTASAALQPKWHDGDATVTLSTQNSYAYLVSVLGQRRENSFLRPHTAAADATDPHWNNPFQPWFTSSGSFGGNLDRPGAFDVYRMKFSATQTVHIDLAGTRDPNLDTVLMVYDGTGQALQPGGFNDDRAPGKFGSHLDFTVQGGQTYCIVVGTYGAYPTGSYLLTVVDDASQRRLNAIVHSTISLPAAAVPVQQSSGSSLGAGGQAPGLRARMLAVAPDATLSVLSTPAAVRAVAAVAAPPAITTLLTLEDSFTFLGTEVG